MAVTPDKKLNQLRRSARLRLGKLLAKIRAGSKGLSAAEADALANEAKHRARKTRRAGR